MTDADAEWEFGVAEAREEAALPTRDDMVPADERVAAHWVDDNSKLEFRTAESSEAWLRTDTPVISLSNYE